MNSFSPLIAYRNRGRINHNEKIKGGPMDLYYFISLIVLIVLLGVIIIRRLDRISEEIKSIEMRLDEKIYQRDK